MLWGLRVLLAGVLMAGAGEATADATDGFAVRLRAAGAGRGAEAREAGLRALAAIEGGRAAEGDAAAAERCTAGYVAVYNEHPVLDERGDELLYNAAVCAAGHAPAAARALWRAVVERYPRGGLAARSSLALGREGMAIGLFVEAAGDLERFARMAPKEAEARDALQDALVIRMALEQRVEARADWEMLIRVYGGRDPGWTAGIQMAGWQLAQDDAERLKLVLAYLQQHGRAGGVDRMIVASVEAGRLLWERACPRRDTDGPPGLCVSGWAGTWPASGPGKPRHASAIARGEVRLRGEPKEPKPAKDAVQPPATVKRGGGRVCAALLPWEFNVHARDARLVKAAQEHFARARALERSAQAEKLEDPRRAEALREALASARLYEADAGLEALMTGTVPEVQWTETKGERLNPKERERREASLRRFNEFYTRMMKQAQAVLRQLDAVREARVARPMIASAGRWAALYRAVAARLLAVPVPRGIGVDVEATYCAAMADQALPLTEELASALMFCVERASWYGVFGADARVCEAELERRMPAMYPRLAELLPGVGLAEWEPVSEPAGLEAPVGVSGGAAGTTVADGERAASETR